MFDFWRVDLNAGKVSKHIPLIPIFDDTGDVPYAPAQQNRINEDDKTNIAGASITSKNLRCLREYGQDIPINIRRSTAQFGRLQCLFLKAIKHCDGFQDFFETETQNGNLNYLLISLILSLEFTANTTKWKSFLYKAMTQNRRNFLEDTFGRPLSKSQYRFLCKVDFEALRNCDKEDLRLILEKMNLPYMLQGSRHLKTIYLDMLHSCVDLPTCLPKSASIYAKILGQATSPSFLTTALEAQSKATDFDINISGYKRPPRDKSDLQALEGYAKRLNELIETKILESTTLPSSPIKVSDRLKPLDSVKKIFMEANELSLCLACKPYIDRITSGRYYYFQWHDRERATLEIRRKESDTNKWEVTEIKKRNDKDVSVTTLREIESYLSHEKLSIELCKELKEKSHKTN